MRFSFRLIGFLLAIACGASVSEARDFFLTIGGGYAPSGNQASLEKNVLYFQRLLRDQGLDSARHDIYFADGAAQGRDLQVMDRASVPKANRLMAEFFGSSEDLGLSYRNHEIKGVRGATTPENIRRWFANVGSTMRGGDRLFLYVTAHGNRSENRRDEYDTTIATWNNTSIKMTEFVRMLDRLPRDVEVVAIMVQCHAGGFSHFIYNDGDPQKGLSDQKRIGFYATVHDRAAAGCTADVDEETYVEYSTYFWAALGGHDRSGDPIDVPDYDGNGVVTFDEAHAYTILTADTIDLPVKTSGEFLTYFSKFGEDNADLLTNDESYALIHKLATPCQKAMLEGLSRQLQLSGDDRIVDAWRATQPREDERRGSGRGRFRGRRPARPGDAQRRRIALALEKRWPGLANVLNPISIDLMTTRSDEFIDAIEKHPDYAEYRHAVEQAPPDAQKRKVKYERFLRVADNVALAENLKRMKKDELIAQYQSLLDAESGSMKTSP